MRQLWVCGAGVLALACAKPRSDEQAVEKIEAFAELMCACKDKACADAVQDRFTKWGQEMAQVAQRHEPNAKMVERATSAMERYTACATKILTAEVPPTAQVPTLPVPPPPHRVEALVQLARDEVARTARHLVLSSLTASYARSDGTLDPKYGALRLEFRARPVADDRPLGAPVTPGAPAPEECPIWTFGDQQWRRQVGPCEPTVELASPRCTAHQIWQRAIADGAPQVALATLSLEPAAGDMRGPYWQFSIVDEPRGVHIQKRFLDDCQPVLEKP